MKDIRDSVKPRDKRVCFLFLKNRKLSYKCLKWVFILIFVVLIVFSFFVNLLSIKDYKSIFDCIFWSILFVLSLYGYHISVELLFHLDQNVK